MFDILKAPLSHPIEATIEVNPEDLTLEKAKLFKANNINRVSLGVQTFQNHLLEKIGRHHTLDIVKKALNDLVEAGIERISIDFIYGLPNQTFEDIKKTDPIVPGEMIVFGYQSKDLDYDDKIETNPDITIPN